MLRTAGAGWVRFCSRNLLRIRNAEVLDTLPRERSVVIASNHRSYADMYLLSSVVLPRARWIERAYFPVRTEYIYERIGGLLLNALASGLAMYPPIYRQPARRALNRDSLTFLVDELRRPGTLVGMHPEGRRGTSADPYLLLPAQPGIGEIVHRAGPIVVPAFINGLPDDLFAALKANFNASLPPVAITMTFGAPLTFDEERAAPPGARSSLRIAEAIRSDIGRLGEADRQLRATITAL